MGARFRAKNKKGDQRGLGSSNGADDGRWTMEMRRPWRLVWSGLVQSNNGDGSPSPEGRGGLGRWESKAPPGLAWPGRRCNGQRWWGNEQRSQEEARGRKANQLITGPGLASSLLCFARPLPLGPSRRDALSLYLVLVS